MIESLSAFEQWKQMVILLCNSEKEMLGEQVGMFLDFIPVLYAQIEELPKDFLIAEI